MQEEQGKRVLEVREVKMLQYSLLSHISEMITPTFCNSFCPYWYAKFHIFAFMENSKVQESNRIKMDRVLAEFTG